MKIQTLTDLFEYTLKNHGDTACYYEKDEKKNFVPRSFKETYGLAENLGIALMDMGIQPQDKIGLIADNRSEWAVADMGVILNGAVDVPRGTDSTPQEIEYILTHSESKVAFFEHKAALEKFKPILDKTQVETVIVLDPEFDGTDANTLSLSDLIKKGADLREARLEELKKRSQAVKEDDLFTIIYTSGTTGNPKGVMLSHANMIFNTQYVPPMLGLRNGDRCLSILPIWHVFERACDYAIVRNGGSIYFTNVRDLRDDFQRVKPTFMVSAPRLWENLYQGILTKLEKGEASKKKMFDLAYSINRHYKKSVDYLRGNTLQVHKESIGSKIVNGSKALFIAWNLLFLQFLANAVVFKKIREALGGNMRGTVSGGGALPTHVDEFFNAIGIPVLEGYGMTECSPIISVRTHQRVIQGTVGFVTPGTEVKILSDKGEEVSQGEIGIVHVKGVQVMQGYYKNQEATDKALQNGWLNTGDLGFISANGTLSIRGRAKDTIVLLGGENVEPVPIENLLVENPLINQVMIVGQDQKTLGALIWPDFEKMKEEGLDFNGDGDLNKNAEIRKVFTGIIKKTVSADSGFKGFERVSGFQFLPKSMEVGDELTNLYKMKRNVISDKYDDLIKNIYS